MAQNRRNRRVTTWGRVLRDNSLYDLRILEDGEPVDRSDPALYRRRNVLGAPYTGPYAPFQQASREAYRA